MTSLEEKILPINKDLLTKEQELLVTELAQFQAPYLEEKLLQEEVFSTSEVYREALTEFKKYVILVMLGNKHLAMTSKPVDEVWHQFILFTPQYHEFCERFLGEYLHHLPKTSYTPLYPLGRKGLKKAYTMVYGTLPAMWEMSEDCGEASGSCGCRGESCGTAM